MLKQLFICTGIAVLTVPLLPQVVTDNNRFSQGRKHILFLGASQYYAHDAVSKAMYTMARLGEESKLYDVMFRTDFRLVTKAPIKEYLNSKNLDYFDAVMLFTQGELRLSDSPERRPAILRPRRWQGPAGCAQRNRF